MIHETLTQSRVNDMPLLLARWVFCFLLGILSEMGSGGLLCTNCAADLIRGPYLQSATPTSLIVRWRTDVPTDGQVRFGTEVGVLAASAADPTVTTEHSLVLTDLEPDTRYFYAIGSSQQSLASGPDYFFVMPPAAAKPTRVWIIGDAGYASTTPRAVRDACTLFNGGHYTDLWLMLGDNAYPTGSDASYQEAVFDLYPAFLRQTAL